MAAADHMHRVAQSDASAAAIREGNVVVVVVARRRGGMIGGDIAIGASPRLAPATLSRLLRELADQVDGSPERLMVPGLPKLA